MRNPSRPRQARTAVAHFDPQFSDFARLQHAVALARLLTLVVERRAKREVRRILAVYRDDRPVRLRQHGAILRRKLGRPAVVAPVHGVVAQPRANVQ